MSDLRKAEWLRGSSAGVVTRKLRVQVQPLTVTGFFSPYSVVPSSNPSWPCFKVYKTPNWFALYLLRFLGLSVLTGFHCKIILILSLTKSNACHLF